jgi:molybdenum cofactor cytidylyltransferase
VAGVVGIVLGAGASRRLGRPKQTLPFGDTTLLGWTLRNVEASSLERVVLVVGGAADEALAGLAPTRATVARNDAYGTGCASSLLSGLDNAGEAEAVMLLLGDMPGVDAGVIDEVRRGWEEAGRPRAAVTSYRDGLGHPFVFSSDAFGTLRGLHGDKAVWKIVDRDTVDSDTVDRDTVDRDPAVVRIAVDRPLPLDVDTEDDYRAALRAVLGRGARPSGHEQAGAHEAGGVQPVADHRP